jgi:hypothetical protein
MPTEAQKKQLGVYAHMGFTLSPAGDETSELRHHGELIAQFAQLGVTQEAVWQECARHLMAKHSWPAPSRG